MSFEAAVDLALAQDPDLIVWLGDVFDHPRPTYRSFRVAQRALARIREHGVPLVVITRQPRHAPAAGHGQPLLGPGRHVPRRPLRPPHGLRALRASPACRSTPCPRCSPSTPPSRPSTEADNAAAASTDTNLLLTHPRDHPGRAPPRRHQRDRGRRRRSCKSDLVLLGHYHFHTKVTEGIWYAGSTDTFSFADDPDKAKGIVVLDTDTGECRHVPLAGQRPLVTLDVGAALGLSPAEVEAAVLERAAAVPDGRGGPPLPGGHRPRGLPPARPRGGAGGVGGRPAAQARARSSRPPTAMVELPELDIAAGPVGRATSRARTSPASTVPGSASWATTTWPGPSRSGHRLTCASPGCYLQNYRVFEDPLDLELPPGLVGIYGPNGAGKSTLVESIRWTLFGRSRTANDEIRTAGVQADCVTEVEFEHEGHLYLVRRTIAGASATVKAQAHADGMQVAEGVRDTARYVHSILGMDDTAFRASVFAEQKQLAAFSDQPPGRAARARARAARHHAARRGPRPGPQGRPRPRPRRSTACASCCPTWTSCGPRPTRRRRWPWPWRRRRPQLEVELEAGTGRVRGRHAGLRPARGGPPGARAARRRGPCDARPSWSGRWWRCASWSSELAALDADIARLAALAADADGWRGGRGPAAVGGGGAWRPGRRWPRCPSSSTRRCPTRRATRRRAPRPRRPGPRCRRCRPGWRRPGPSATGPGVAVERSGRPHR